MIPRVGQEVTLSIHTPDGWKEIASTVVEISDPMPIGATFEHPVNLTLTGEWDLSESAQQWLEDLLRPRDLDLGIFPIADFDVWPQFGARKPEGFY